MERDQLKRVAFEALDCGTRLVELLDRVRAETTAVDFEIQKRWIAGAVYAIHEHINRPIYELEPGLQDEVEAEMRNRSRPTTGDWGPILPGVRTT